MADPAGYDGTRDERAVGHVPGADPEVQHVQFAVSIPTALATAGASVLGVLVVVVLTRMNGLLSFAKMAPHDFAATIAIGSLLATAAAGSIPVAQALVALAAVFATQRVLQRWRRHGGARLTDNEPMLLMAGSEVLEENLRSTGITRDDLVAKLREANVTDPRQVYAVVLEATGDVSVLHGETARAQLDTSLLDGVRGCPDETTQPTSWAAGTTS